MTHQHHTYALTIAAAAALALTGCSLNLDHTPTAPTPATPITAPRATPITTAPATTTGRTPSGSGTTAASTGTDLVDAGAPTVLSNPSFTLDAVDLTAPEQVAWAYLTERLSYSYRDPEPGAGVARAARYLTPDATTPNPPPTQQPTDQTDHWARAVAEHTVAATTITQLTLPRTDDPAPGAGTLIVATWTRVLSTNTGPPLRHADSTTLTLQRQTDNTWRINDPGFPAPG